MTINQWNPTKVTKSPNPAKTIQRQESKERNLATPKASRLMNESAKQTAKDSRITLPKPKVVK